VKLISWLPSATVISAIFILAATLFPYFETRHRNTVAGYLPIAVGLVVIMALTSFLTFIVSPPDTRRFSTAVGAGALVGVAFFFVFLLFTLNTLGS
jgi:site-specific recombinase